MSGSRSQTSVATPDPRALRVDALRALLDGLAAPAAIHALDARLVHANGPLARLLGAEPADLVGLELDEAGGALGRQLRAPALHAARTGGAVTVELAAPAPGETARDRQFRVTAVPIRDEHGEVDLVCTVGSERGDQPDTAAARLHARIELLASAGRVLLQAGTLHEGLDQMTALAVPALADRIVIHLALPGGSGPQLVCAAHEEADQRRAMATMLDAAPLDIGATRLVDPGAPVDAVERHLVDAWAPWEPTSIIAAPIDCHGEAVGAITFVMAESRRRFDADDLWLADELGHRASLACANHRDVAQVEQRARAGTVLTHITDGVLMVSDEGIVEVWNPAAEALTGLRAADIVGRRAHEAIPGWAELRERVPTRPSPDPRGRTELVPLVVDGGDRWLQVSGASFPGGTVYAFSNATDRGRADALAGDFIGTVSHELRTPLASIYGAATTLQRDDLELDPAVHAQLVETIVQESTRLTARIDTILAAASAASRTLHEPDAPLAVHEVVVEAVAEAREGLPAGHELELELPDEPPPLACGDAERLRPVLDALLDNAVTYSPAGGTVTVRCEVVGRSVRTSVSDEGIGIEPAALTQVFERFYRVDASHALGTAGTGLGLYICKSLVQAMGGFIDAASTPGRGSTFWFDLPLAEPADA